MAPDPALRLSAPLTPLIPAFRKMLVVAFRVRLWFELQLTGLSTLIIPALRPEGLAVLTVTSLVAMAVSSTLVSSKESWIAPLSRNRPLLIDGPLLPTMPASCATDT